MKRTIAILLMSVATLATLGAVMLYSATMTQFEPLRFFSHLRWLGAGCLCCAVAACIDYSWLKRWHLPVVFLGLSLLLLGLVLIPGVGEMRNGARRWLPIGQPSEFAKIALVIALAAWGTTYQARMRERNTGFLFPGLMTAVTVILIFLEPDWGTAILVASIGALMLLVAGAPIFYLLSAGIIGVQLLTLLLLQNPARLARVLVYLEPEKHQHGAGWQIWHSVLSIGSGGIWGTLIGEGRHKLGFVPEQQTDFILSLIGEELGLAGTLLVLSLFALIFLCGVRIVWRAQDTFAQLLSAGLTLLIALQALINVGVVTSSLPNKGLPLPFVSYGGSNLVCLLACVGLLVSVARRVPVFETPAVNAPAPSAAAQTFGPFDATSSPPAGASNRTAWWRRLFACLLGRGAARRHRPLRSYQLPPRAASTQSGMDALAQLKARWAVKAKS